MIGEVVLAEIPISGAVMSAPEPTSASELRSRNATETAALTAICAVGLAGEASSMFGELTALFAFERAPASTVLAVTTTWLPLIVGACAGSPPIVALELWLSLIVSATAAPNLTSAMELNAAVSAFDISPSVPVSAPATGDVM